MLTTKMRLLLLCASLLLILHGVEEYLTGFYNVDPIFQFLFKPLLAMSVYQSTFLVFQIFLWLALLLFFLSSLGGKWPFVFFGSVGFFLFFEIHHVVEAVVRGSYYPGLVTACLLPILGLFYWKELAQNWKKLSN